MFVVTSVFVLPQVPIEGVEEKVTVRAGVLHSRERALGLSCSSKVGHEASLTWISSLFRLAPLRGQPSKLVALVRPPRGKSLVFPIKIAV